MSQCTVPSWNVKSQRQEQVGGDDEECNRSSHVHDHLFQIPRLAPASNYEVTELTWENGQLAMHGLGGFLQTGPTKPPTWGRANETLESIVHESTISHKHHPPILHHHDQDQIAPNNNINISIASTNVASSDHGNNRVAATIKKRTRSESNYQNCGTDHNNSVDGSRCVKYIQEHDKQQQKKHVDRSACGSASATANTYCRDSDTTMMTWNSFESPRSRSFKTKTTDDDSACHDGSENQYEDRETKTETVRSQSSRRTRAAAIHNQSERRRRDRINQKMKALQKLVPNASKTDKASMLDEVIEYLKQLQAQVQMMTSSMRNMPSPMMMQMGMQQQQQQHQLQMSLLAAARMSMGIGSLGLPHPQLFHQTMAAANPTFVPQPFVVPQIIPPAGAAPRPNPADPGTNNNAVSLPDAYCAFLTQSMDMDFCNKMAALYRQQVSQSTQAASRASLSKDMQDD